MTDDQLRQTPSRRDPLTAPPSADREMTKTRLDLSERARRDRDAEEKRLRTDHLKALRAARHGR